MPSVARKPPSKRRVKPYAQGDLDSMCGIYAIINAFRALCREITLEISAQLFQRLVRSLNRHAKQAHFSIIFGTGRSLMGKLLSEAQSYLKKRLKIELAIEPKGRELKSKSLEAAWRRLSAIVDETTVLILPLGGRWDHWTVLYDIKPHKIRLIDSSNRRELTQSQCTLEATKTRYCLELSGAIAISRVRPCQVAPARETDYDQLRRF